MHNINTKIINEWWLYYNEQRKHRKYDTETHDAKSVGVVCIATALKASELRINVVIILKQQFL